jgi:hypothetical protein
MKKLKKFTLKRPRQSFTLAEVGIASMLMALIFTGAMMLFINASRTVTKLGSGLTAARAASRVQQFVSLELEESYGFVLPNDTVATGGVVWSTSLGSKTNYLSDNTASEAGWAGQLNTGAYILAPAPGTAAVQSGTGTTVSLSGTLQPVDRAVTSVTNTTLIFRGNPNGTANPGYGTCLWMWRYTNGARTEQRLLTNEISTAWNAVSFTRTTGSRRSLIVKIVCGDGSYPGGEQTNDSSDGVNLVNRVSGRTVYLSNSALYTSITIPYPTATNLIPQPNNATPVPTPVPTPSPTPTPVPTPTPLPTPTPTPTPVPTPTPTPGPPTPVPTPTPTPRPATPTPTPRPATPTPTPTPVPTPTPTPTPKPTPVPIG